MPMDPPSREVRARGAQQIIRGKRDELGNRGSSMDDSGRVVCGKPRPTSAKHAFNMKRVRGEKSKFDSFNSGDGQASEKGEFAKRLAAIDATLGPPVIPLK
jgi:hypothetical protein